MKELISNRLLNMTESQTLAMASKSRELKAKGLDIINLSLGEPDFDTPEFIKQAAINAIQNNVSHYPPVPGFEDLREAICKKFKRDNNLTYAPNQIVVSTGAKQSLINVVLSLVNPGDEIILPTPYWVSYSAMGELAEAKIVEVKADITSDFKITPKQLTEAITAKSKLIIFSSPCNPSGSVYTEPELRALAEVILQHDDVYVISDEIYEHINFSKSHFSIGSIPEMQDRVITVNGVSKGFAMTGYRLGYIGAPEWIAKAATKIQGQFTSGANTIAQMAAKAAVEAHPECTHHMFEVFLRRRDFLINELKQVEKLQLNIPQGAFYLFPDVSKFFGTAHNGFKINNASDLSLYLLNEALVATVTGEAFGNPNCIRLSYATSDEILATAAERIILALNKLK